MCVWCGGGRWSLWGGVGGVYGVCEGVLGFGVLWDRWCGALRGVFGGGGVEEARGGEGGERRRGGMGMRMEV